MNKSPCSTCEFINIKLSYPSPKNQTYSNSRLLRKEVFSQKKSNPTSINDDSTDRESKNANENTLKNQLNSDDLQIIQNACFLNNVSDETNTKKIEKSRLLNRSDNSQIYSKSQSTAKKASKFDAIEFEDDQNNAFFSNDEIDGFDNDLYLNDDKLNKNAIDDITILDEDCSSVLKGIIREEILEKAKSNEPHIYKPFQNGSSFSSNSYSFLKGKKHILNVLEFMGNNDIPLEEKHQQLQQSCIYTNDNDKEAQENEIVKNMNSCLEEQGMDPLEYLKTDLPKARPPSRETRKSIYD